MKITKFEDLECWQEARKLTNKVFVLTMQLPFNKTFRLADQMTGAAISAMNNIVEGFDSQSNAEFIRFLSYARRSGSEVQTCLYVALDNGFIKELQFQDVYQQALKTRQVVDGLLRYLRSCSKDERTQRAKRTQRTQPVYDAHQPMA